MLRQLVALACARVQTRPLPLGYGTKVHYDDIILRLTFQEKDKRGKIKLQCVVALFLLIVHFFICVIEKCIIKFEYGKTC